MSIGFTGTGHGMTDYQRLAFAEAIRLIQPVEFHHGDCVGADAEAHEIVRRVAPACVIVIHPPAIKAKRAFCHGDKVLDPEDYLVRNHRVVDAVNSLIATPQTIDEVLRSGTWATVRYARKKLPEKNILIIPPYNPK